MGEWLTWCRRFFASVISGTRVADCFLVGIEKQQGRAAAIPG